MKKQFHLTAEKIAELKTELSELQGKRADIADAIRSARELGDLAENAEYQAARADGERNDARTAEIEYILANTEVIKAPKGGKEVRLGSTVTLRGEKGKEMVMQVVGTVEADPLARKISDESPIGKALIGKKEGEQVEIKLPAGLNVYHIASIA